jgi:hypothetical protein
MPPRPLDGARTEAQGIPFAPGENNMRREKPTKIEIQDEAGGGKTIVRSYADGRIEREPIMPKVGPRKRHILGVRKLSLDKTRKKAF